MLPEATSERHACPWCGAPADPEARQCGFCSAPLATVRCATCFHMSWPSALHCTGCGRALGLEPIGEESQLSCPSCARRFDAFRGGPGMLYDCGKCGGQFVEQALLSELLERREVCGNAVPRRTLSRTAPAVPVQYVPCPACRQLMNRHNFGGTSGVIVDVCARHGVWFDAGELPRVLEFVENGGLARARRREREEAEAARRKLSAAAADAVRGVNTSENGIALPDDPATYTFDPEWKSLLWRDAKEAFTGILHELGERLGKR